MSFKTIKISTLMESGQVNREDIVQHILLMKLLKDLSEFNDSENVDNQRLEAYRYREIQDLLNNYLNTNITYGSFDYSSR